MRKHFITGLVILLPLAVTIAIFMFVINFLTKPFIGIVSNFLKSHSIINKGLLFLSPEQLLLYGSKMIILVCLMGVTLLLGMIARWFFFRAFFKTSDKILMRIPLINKVYKTSQEIIRTIFVNDKNAFKRVVMVPISNSGSYVIGFLSKEAPSVCSSSTGRKLWSVLVPTAPNPTTGFLMMCQEEDLIYVDGLTPEHAIKYIVSCGVIIPESAVKDMVTPKDGSNTNIN